MASSTVRLVVACLAMVAGCSLESPPPSRADLAQAVGVTLGACLPQGASTGDTARAIVDIETELNLGGETVGALGHTVFLDPEALHCVYRAGPDCVAARECLGLTYEAVDTCGGSEDVQCSLGQVVSCDPGGVPTPFLVARDCARSGQLCVEPSEPGLVPWCVDGVCDSAGVTTRCLDATHFEVCQAGGLVHGTCRSGSICSEEFGGCVGAGDGCTTDVCVGDAFVPCDPFNHRTTTPIDCAAIGLRCHVWETLDTAGCVPHEPAECSPSDAAACRDGTLVYCGIDHRRREYDCVAHGYLGCDRDHCLAAAPAL